MRIVGASSLVSTVARRGASATHDGAPSEPPRGALVVVEAHRRDEYAPQWSRHPSAPFVAHLIATRMQAPQTRSRRRAEPEEATEVYRSMTKPVMARRAFGMRV